MGEVSFVAMAIFIFSFFLNFVWESLHGFSLFEGHHIDSGKYVVMMTHMSLMDAVTILGIYLAVAFFEKNLLWLKNFNKKNIVVFFVLGLIVAVLAEFNSVYLTKEWQYNSYMPIIFGIGLSPLVQLSITGLLSIWLAKRVYSKS